MPVALRLPGALCDRSAQPRETFYLVRPDSLEEARRSYTMPPYYQEYLVSSTRVDEEHKRRQVGPACPWGHQAAFCFRESGLQFTVKQLRESSNHSLSALPACPCSLLLP